MTQLLEKALTEAAKLPDTEQDVLAAILLQEIASEQRWSNAFANSQATLADLAQAALAEDSAGRTKAFPEH